MKSGVVAPWTLRDRWDFPSSSGVVDTPEAEWLMCIARIVDIEAEGRMGDFNVEAGEAGLAMSTAGRSGALPASRILGSCAPQSRTLPGQGAAMLLDF